MRIIDIEEVRVHLEQLIDELKPGECFAVSVDGMPKVKAVALHPNEIEQLAKAGKPGRRRQLRAFPEDHRMKHGLS